MEPNLQGEVRQGSFGGGIFQLRASYVNVLHQKADQHQTECFQRVSFLEISVGLSIGGRLEEAGRTEQLISAWNRSRDGSTWIIHHKSWHRKLQGGMDVHWEMGVIHSFYLWNSNPSRTPVVLDVHVQFAEGGVPQLHFDRGRPPNSWGCSPQI